MDFNDLFILECFNDEKEREFFDMYVIPSLKDFNFSTRFQFLKREELLVEDPNDTTKMIISVKGKAFLQDLLSELNSITSESGQVTTRVVIMDMKSDEERFEEWWKLYPTTTAWTSDDGNSKFIGSRNLKNIRKAAAKKAYLKLLNQGLKHEELMGSLKYEVKLKKIDSIKKNVNQLEYFKGMESYLNQERYLLYIENFRDNPEFVKEGEKIQSKKQNVTDI